MPMVRGHGRRVRRGRLPGSRSGGPPRHAAWNCPPCILARSPWHGPQHVVALALAHRAGWPGPARRPGWARLEARRRPSDSRWSTAARRAAATAPTRGRAARPERPSSRRLGPPAADLPTARPSCARSPSSRPWHRVDALERTEPRGPRRTPRCPGRRYAGDLRGAAGRDPGPGQRPARPPGARPLGRDAAAPGRRARRHGRALRLRRAAHAGHDGGPLRPDLVVRLAGGKNVVVDAKVPFAAYLEARSAEDPAARGAPPCPRPPPAQPCGRPGRQGLLGATSSRPRSSS